MMMTVLKIGVIEGELAEGQAIHTQHELEKLGISSEIIVLKKEREQSAGNALLQGEVDVIVQALPDLHTTQPEELAITAVSQREEPADCLVIHPDKYDNTALFKMNKGIRIGSSGQHRRVQLLDYRPDIEWTDIEGESSQVLEMLKKGDCDAIILPKFELTRLKTDNAFYKIIELNPIEFIPAPGQGVLAWLCHKNDLPTRRIFKALHHSEVAACTNIERKILQLARPETSTSLAAYCHRDANGNYHINAVCEINGEVRRARLSSSTSFGVAEKTVLLMNNEQ